METSDSVHDTHGRDVVSANHSLQHFSLDSFRSTRGGSEVPNVMIDPQVTPPMYDSKAVMKAVGSKLKAVFYKGKENLGLEKVAS